MGFFIWGKMKIRTKRNITNNLEANRQIKASLTYQTTEPKTPTEKIMRLMEIMTSVKTDTDEAQLNVTSISDNNGGRILL
jgi:hypothetical protein